MLQAILIKSGDYHENYDLIPLTSIVRAQYSMKPFPGMEDTIVSEEGFFKVTVLGAEIQILECFIFGNTAAQTLKNFFRQDIDFGVVDVPASDILERYLIR